MANVDLETFIKQTLLQIQKGVDNAANELSKNASFIISPYGVHSKGDIKSWSDIPYKKSITTGINLYNIREIEFDVAVTASEENKGDTKAGLAASIKVMGAAIGASVGTKEEKMAQDSSISRIKFSIPVGFASRFVPD